MDYTTQTQMNAVIYQKRHPCLFVDRRHLAIHHLRLNQME